MTEQLSQHPDEESRQEREELELKFERECLVDELAQFISNLRTGEDHRMKLSQEQAIERIEYYLKYPNAIELILREGGELIGCAFAYEQSKEELDKEVPGVNLFSRDGERIFTVREVDVKAQRRGRGYGRRIMEEIMREARVKGATKLLLSPFPYEDNPAYKLYKRLGFKEVSPDQDPQNFYMSYEYEKVLE